MNASPLRYDRLLHWLLALAPAALFARSTPRRSPRQPAGRGSRPAAGSARPRRRWVHDAGRVLLVQIKPDQTAAFEEMIDKLKAGLAATQDAALKTQAAGFKVYKAAEPWAATRSTS